MGSHWRNLWFRINPHAAARPLHLPRWPSRLSWAGLGAPPRQPWLSSSSSSCHRVGSNRLDSSWEPGSADTRFSLAPSHRCRGNQIAPAAFRSDTHTHSPPANQVPQALSSHPHLPHSPCAHPVGLDPTKGGWRCPPRQGERSCLLAEPVC